jgi:hypothetical protein
MFDWLIHVVWAVPALAQTAVPAASDAVNQMTVDFIRGCLDIKSTAEQCIQLSHLPDATTLINQCKLIGMDANQCLSATQAQVSLPAAGVAQSVVPVVTATVPSVPVVVSPPAAPVSPSSDGSTLALAIGPVVEGLLTLAAAAITAGVPIALTWARQHLRLMQDAVLAEQIAGAATRGAGLAAEYLRTAASEGRVLTVDVKRTAVAVGVQYMLNSYPDAIAKLKVSPDHRADMVIGELGKQAIPTLPSEQAVPINPPASPPSDPPPISSPAGSTAAASSLVASLPSSAPDWPIAPRAA